MLLNAGSLLARLDSRAKGVLARGIDAVGILLCSVLTLRLLEGGMVGDHLRLDLLEKPPRQRGRHAAGFGLGFDAPQLGRFPSRIAKG